jgi:hypothetical protein
MLPWYAFRLISSPISMVMHVRMRQRLMLVMTVSGLALRVLPLLVVLFLAPDRATLVFAITSALFYGMIVVVFLSVAGIPSFALAQLVVRELILWVGTVSVAFLISGVFGSA